jgi:hypothetical protein
MPRLQYYKNEADEFVCPSCGKVEAHQNTMHYHMKKCNGQTYKCPHCHSDFIQEHSLNIHMNAAHPEHAQKEVPIFECPYPACNHSSYYKGTVRSHYLRKHCKDLLSPLINPEQSNHCLCCQTTFLSQPAFIYHTITCIRLLPADFRLAHLNTLT